jgi:hypothetical protein
MGWPDSVLDLTMLYQHCECYRSVENVMEWQIRALKCTCGSGWQHTQCKLFCKGSCYLCLKELVKCVLCSSYQEQELQNGSVLKYF